MAGAKVTERSVCSWRGPWPLSSTLRMETQRWRKLCWEFWHCLRGWWTSVSIHLNVQRFWHASYEWTDRQHQAGQTNTAEYFDTHFIHTFKKATNKKKEKRKNQNNKTGESERLCSQRVTNLKKIQKDIKCAHWNPDAYWESQTKYFQKKRDTMREEDHGKIQGGGRKREEKSYLVVEVQWRWCDLQEKESQRLPVNWLTWVHCKWKVTAVSAVLNYDFDLLSTRIISQ